MNTDRLREIAPHYAAMFLLVVLVLAAVQAVVGELDYWVEFGIVLVTVFAYRPLVVRLGIGPSAWEQS